MRIVPFLVTHPPFLIPHPSLPLTYHTKVFCPMDGSLYTVFQPSLSGSRK